MHDRVDRHRTAHVDVDYRGASRKYEAGDVFGENATWQADKNGGKDKSFLSTISDHAARHEETEQTDSRWGPSQAERFLLFLVHQTPTNDRFAWDRHFDLF